MKKAIYLVVILFLTLSSCSSRGDSSSSTSEIQSIASTGTWKITYLNNNGGVIKTVDYQGYNFQFNVGDNSVIASNSINSYNGVWDIIQDPDHNNINYFDINYQQPQTFKDLTGLWDITSITNNKIQLHYSTTNDSYFNPTIDPLTINKNMTLEKN